MPFNKLTDAEDERLTVLAEECAEVIQAICKIQRHGYESYNPFGDPTINNRRLLENEMGDVLWAMSKLIASHDVENHLINKAANAAEERKAPYLHHHPVKHESASCCYGVGCNVCEPQGRG